MSHLPSSIFQRIGLIQQAAIFLSPGLQRIRLAQHALSAYHPQGYLSFSGIQMGPRRDLQRPRELKAESSTLSERQGRRQGPERPTSLASYIFSLPEFLEPLCHSNKGRKESRIMFFPICLWCNIFLSYIQYKHFC